MPESTEQVRRPPYSEEVSDLGACWKVPRCLGLISSWYGLLEQEDG